MTSLVNGLTDPSGCWAQVYFISFFDAVAFKPYFLNIYQVGGSLDGIY